MGMAVALSRGDLTVEDCPDLSPADREAVRAVIPRPSDWRTDLVRSLLDELKGVDLSLRRQALGLTGVTPSGCTLTLFGREISVGPEGIGPGLDVWDQILVLRYLLNPAHIQPTGKWKAFRDLRDGSVKAEGFRKECERPLAAVFERSGSTTLTRILGQMGGQVVEDQFAPFAMKLSPLPRLPLLLLIWPGDAEFAADAKVLLDETAATALDVESLIFLGERLVARVETACEDIP